MNVTEPGDQVASTPLPLWRRVVATAVGVPLITVAMFVVASQSVIGSFDLGLLESLLVGIPILGVVQGALAWVLSVRSRYRSAVHHRRRMLAEVAAGIVIAAAPAVWLPLNAHSAVVGTVTTTHNALFGIACGGLCFVQLAAMAHVWVPLSWGRIQLRAARGNT